MLGSGGMVTLGRPGIVGRLGRGGCVVGKVGNVGCGSVGIEGIGGNVGLGKFGTEAGGGERNGIEGIVVGIGIVGIEGMLGSGGMVTLGRPGIVGRLGSGGCVVGKVGKANSAQKVKGETAEDDELPHRLKEYGSQYVCTDVEITTILQKSAW
ncbi:unnamed protein product [Dovyalis caffra]|uniref:Uncharacterized protein n=1 Tax=Dovyalis caffra TaxID=77055 RepID=A0AAV1SMN3_9ROSI|nr:unnamed protein product [Dovyalis caffra]